jgi:hypothetical protein
LPPPTESSGLSSLVRSVVDFVNDSSIINLDQQKNENDKERPTIEEKNINQYIGPPFKDITKFLDEVTEGMFCENN